MSGETLSAPPPGGALFPSSSLGRKGEARILIFTGIGTPPYRPNLPNLLGQVMPNSTPPPPPPLSFGCGFFFFFVVFFFFFWVFFFFLGGVFSYGLVLWGFFACIVKPTPYIFNLSVVFLFSLFFDCTHFPWSIWTDPIGALDLPPSKKLFFSSEGRPF